MKCWTVEHDTRGTSGTIRNRIGAFERFDDAERYVQDVFPNGRANPKILPATANAVTEWGRDRLERKSR